MLTLTILLPQVAAGRTDLDHPGTIQASASPSDQADLIDCFYSMLGQVEASFILPIFFMTLTRC